MISFRNYFKGSGGPHLLRGPYYGKLCLIVIKLLLRLILSKRLVYKHSKKLVDALVLWHFAAMHFFKFASAFFSRLSTVKELWCNKLEKKLLL